MSAWKDFYFLSDIFLVPAYLLAILLIAGMIASRKKETDPLYRYYVPALFLKIAGGLLFTAVYTFYYPGGDCHAYFWNSKVLVNLGFKHPEPFFSILAGNTTPENRSFFDQSTGFPTKTMFLKGGESFAVARFMVPFSLLGLKHMLLATILLDVFSFYGIWKFFRMVCGFYPAYHRKLAIAVLFIPSLLFWGSGIMKDTFTLTAALWSATNIFSVFLFRKKIFGNLAMLIVNMYILVSLKPYIAVALIPCLALAVAHQHALRIGNRLLGLFFAPTLIIAGIFGGISMLSLFGSMMGTYSSIEGALSKAQINQQDLIRSEQYGTHSFDIGPFDASVGGLFTKAPQAVIAGLFRPFLWEAGNAVMLISGLENTILILLTIYVLFSVRPRQTIAYFASQPYLLFALVFSLIFAFSVGLSTANFGALVRYRIPGIPFFASILAILWEAKKESRRQE